MVAGKKSASHPDSDHVYADAARLSPPPRGGQGARMAWWFRGCRRARAPAHFSAADVEHAPTHARSFSFPHDYASETITSASVIRGTYWQKAPPTERTHHDHAECHAPASHDPGPHPRPPPGPRRRRRRASSSLA